jgi:hypothetical protein
MPSGRRASKRLRHEYFAIRLYAITQAGQAASSKLTCPQIASGYLPMSINFFRFSLLGLTFALCLASCAPDGATVKEPQYATKLVGDWQGTVGDMREGISFTADGKFVSKVRPRGFISNTLGQGITGTVRGTWAISGNVISLHIDSAEDETVLNKMTTSTIESFKQDGLVVRSSKGETSTFVRAI